MKCEKIIISLKQKKIVVVRSVVVQFIPVRVLFDYLIIFIIILKRSMQSTQWEVATTAHGNVINPN